MRLRMHHLTHVVTVYDRKTGVAQQQAHGRCPLGHPVHTTRAADGTVLLQGGMTVAESRKTWRAVDRQDLAPRGRAALQPKPRTRTRGVTVDWVYADL